jgi:osmotically-inducible protein OsmY
MPQQHRPVRKPVPKVLPFLAGALAAALVLVACERRAPAADVATNDAAQRTAAPMNVEAPREEYRPQRAPTPLPPREALADTVITSRIRSEILVDPAMQGADVSVNTDHGVVVLAGLVRTPEQTAVASAHAQRQDGVMRVDNHLATAPQ